MSPTAAINNASTGEFFGFVAIISLFALVSFFACWIHWRRALRIDSTPTSKLRSASQGHVELEGVGYALEGDVIRSPASGDRCLWWEYSVHEQQGGKRGRVRVRADRSDELFGFRDTTGHCLIDPQGAAVHTTFSRSWRGNSPHSKPPANSRLQNSKSNTLFSLNIHGGGRYHFQETIIPVRSPIYAMGWLQSVRQTSDPVTVSQDVRDTLRAWKQDPQKMAEFDEDGDGQVDAEEWERAQNQARDEAKKRARETAEHMAVDVLKKPPQRGQSFIISTLSQEDYARHNRQVAVACLVGFLLCGSAVVAACSIRGII